MLATQKMQERLSALVTITLKPELGGLHVKHRDSMWGGASTVSVASSIVCLAYHCESIKV